MNNHVDIRGIMIQKRGVQLSSSGCTIQSDRYRVRPITDPPILEELPRLVRVFSWIGEMAGDWIKMRIDLQDDPAVVAIADKLEIDEFEVVGRLHRLWSWADKHTIDGTSSSVTPRWVDKYVVKTGFADAMVGVGWLTFADGVLSFPKFDVHNGKSAKSRCEAVIRQRKSRSRHSDVTQRSDERSVIPRPFVDAVWRRDNFQCVYCGVQSSQLREKEGRRPTLSIDHIIPVSRGDGRQAIEDLATCCKACNREKNDRTPEEWGLLPTFLQPGVSYKDNMLVTEKCDTSVTKALPEKRREEKRENKTQGVFVPPTIQEVMDYVKHIGAVVDAREFVDHYTANGWLVGKTKMKDWQATVRNWERRRLEARNSEPEAFDECQEFLRLVRIATKYGTNSESDKAWRLEKMTEHERASVAFNSIRYEQLTDPKLHPLERKRIAKLYVQKLRELEAANG